MPAPSSLNELTSKPYYDQAKWFLNGFWKDGAQENAEQIWKVTRKFVELDDKKTDGNELDEFNAHKLLESQGQTLTVIELRNALKAIDMDKNGKMALLEYLLHTYNKTVEQCLNSPQGNDTHKEELAKASSKLASVQKALAEVQTQFDAQQKALAAQKASEEKAHSESDASTKAAAKAKEDETAAKNAAATAKSQLDAQKQAEDTVRAAENELTAAVNELKGQEDAYNAKVKELEETANQEGLSTVNRSKAAAELGQFKAQDQSGLRKAQKSQESVLKKVKADREAAEASTAEAKASHTAAEEAAAAAEASAKSAESAKNAASNSAAENQKKREELEQQTKRVELAQRETEILAREAEQELEELKKKDASAHGAIWWMEREIKEAKDFQPKKNLQFTDI